MTERKYLEAAPQIGNRVWIDPDATVIGDVRLDDDSSDLAAHRIAPAMSIRSASVPAPMCRTAPSVT